MTDDARGDFMWLAYTLADECEELEGVYSSAMLEEARAAKERAEVA